MREMGAQQHSDNIATNPIVLHSLPKKSTGGFQLSYRMQRCAVSFNFHVAGVPPRRIADRHGKRPFCTK